MEIRWRDGWWWHIKKDFKSSLANVGFGESMICPRASDGCLQSWRRRSLPRAPTCFSFGSDLKTCLHITRNMATQLLRSGFRQAGSGIFAYLGGTMRAAVQQGSYDCIHSTALRGIFPTTWNRYHFGRLQLTLIVMIYICSVVFPRGFHLNFVATDLTWPGAGG